MINYCIDCKAEIKLKSKRCRSCANRIKALNRFDKIGRKKYFCIDCRKEVSRYAKRCKECRIINVNNRIHPINCQCCICKARRGEYKGKNNLFYNKKHTRETIRQLSLIHGGTGVPYENAIYSEEFLKLRTKIRKRDKFTCKICRKNGCDVHHIDYNKENNNESNLITLCRSCHMNTNTNRNNWINFFKGII